MTPDNDMLERLEVLITFLKNISVVDYMALDGHKRQLIDTAIDLRTALTTRDAELARMREIIHEINRGHSFHEQLQARIEAALAEGGSHDNT